MTLSLFVVLLTILSLVSSLTTEAFKKAFNITKPTLVDGIISIVAGAGGGSLAYILMGIGFSPTNIICLVLLPLAIWLSSTLGYDKVKEIIEQIAKSGLIKK